MGLGSNIRLLCKAFAVIFGSILPVCHLGTSLGCRWWSAQWVSFQSLALMLHVSSTRVQLRAKPWTSLIDAGDHCPQLPPLRVSLHIQQLLFLVICWKARVLASPHCYALPAAGSDSGVRHREKWRRKNIFKPIGILPRPASQTRNLCGHKGPLPLEGSHTWFNVLLSSSWNSWFLTKRPCIFILHWTPQFMEQSWFSPRSLDSQTPFSWFLCSERRMLSQILGCLHDHHSRWYSRTLLCDWDSPRGLWPGKQKRKQKSRDSRHPLSHRDPILGLLARKRVSLGVFFCPHPPHNSRISASLESKLGDARRKTSGNSLP